MQPQAITVPPFCVRADVGPIDDEKRTVELVFSTGAPVERMDWWTGKRYIEKLSLKPEHIRMDRLNSGAPLLDAHSAYSIHDQIGVVEPDTVRIMAKELRATVRFSRNDAVTPIWQNVKDRIVRSVSVGYKVFRFEETAGKDGGIATRLATDWEPYEISLVPMPADVGSRVRADKSLANTCVLHRRADVAALDLRLRLARAAS